MKTDYETLANKCKTFDDYLNFYTPFIHHVANTYFRPGVDLSDLVQVGRIALYAVWRERPNDHMSMRLNIRRSISASFRQSLSLITEGENLEICRRHTNWRREELQAKQSDSVTPEQVYQSFQERPPIITCDRRRNGQILGKHNWTLSLIRTVFETERLFQQDSLSDLDKHPAYYYDGTLGSVLRRTMLQQVLASCTQHEKRLLRLWAQGWLPQEIAGFLGMNHKTVSTLTWRVKKRCRDTAISLGYEVDEEPSRVVNMAHTKPTNNPTGIGGYKKKVAQS